MQVSTSAWPDGAAIPLRHVCRKYGGDDVSPPLRIRDLPSGTTHLALLFDDPDSPSGTWTHWLFWDMPADKVEIPAGATTGSLGATAGVNSWGRLDHGGPCPGSGTHRYRYRVFAFDHRVGLPEGADRDAFLERAQLALAESVWTGTFSAP